MKKLAFGLIVLLVLGVGFGVFAQTSATGTLKLMERIREKTKISPQEFQQMREEIKNQIEQSRLEYRKQIQEKRDEMKAKIQSLKNQLREKLKQKISEKKSAIVERIYERINALNERMTNHYLDVLEHLEKVLERIESRTAKAKLNGKDVSSVESVIEKAHESINKAREAVKTQAEKIYQPPQITTEENLKLDVGKLRKQLHDDLKAVEKLVKEAKETVRQAAVALAQIPKVDEIEVATSTVATSSETTTQPTQ
jgi:DNA repair exonuclease SbcCD ATPase subunit